MAEKILIVEDEFIVANNLSITLEKAGYKVCGVAGTVEEAREIIKQNKPHLVILDIYLNGELTGIDLAGELSEENIAFVYLSANSNQSILEQAKTTNPYGFMVKPFREKDVIVSLQIAHYLHQQQTEVRRQSYIALEMTMKDAISQDISWEEKFLRIAKTIQPHIPFDFLAIGMKNLEKLPYEGMSFLRLSFNEYQKIGRQELMNITGLKPADLPRFQVPGAEDFVSQIYNGKDFEAICKINPSKKLVAKTFSMGSNLVMYVPIAGKAGFTFSFYSRNTDIYNKKHLGLVKQLEKALAMTFEGIIATAEKSKAQRIHPVPPLPVRMVAAKPEYNGIVGSSHLLLTALDHLTMVAPSETSVLILGESGTGKERFAKCLHDHSLRKNKQIVVVNCAALPSNLIESELFGHEKGAFTGAAERRIGKFEQANGGTIFLDEMGELPLESQAKLLRVLQEKEIERLGGRETLKVDVRIIAATNNNLEKAVAAGKFRLDLYYRLNVFPILLPPLRDRIGDLPILTAHFLKKYSEMAGKPDISIADDAMEDLTAYHWPGNIRELEHIIERHVLLCRGAVIERFTLPNRTEETKAVEDIKRIKSIEENERDYILTVLKKCGGRISGKGGAAELLEVPATTLNSKMKRLGIVRKHAS
ncbi:sigma 54-interacting transcriptional regulator [Pedobacter sp. GSP4]|uniref:sigma 54-interacting transcriptional regulator n=1 Tax=Pedobacter sp. GSP4 TaxID=3453716 RepID=UPI003EE8FDC5